ncbi:capsular polysaccharide biosynthesis protein [Flavobacterium suaedae]|uniref:Capsular polysaccharide biosynthesis protein n=1 Tax=Flavobacterium suaedae TaxID=1767027 RepID=A0ABQ1JMG2_9FLAO|nr:glycosyltransferase family 4 protein [Flavobacterium suaedae]GGB72779.1 capsular polysaccharide biosynthesis protein [Flavobacterium suaedae]
MKILHIYREADEEIGGVENHVKYLVKEQVKQGLYPTVLAFIFSDKNSISIKKIDNIDWYYLELKDPFINLFETSISVFIKRLYQNFNTKQKTDLILKIKPDIIHQHDYLSSIRLNKKLSKNFPVVFTNHSGEYLWLEKTALTRYFQKQFLNCFKAIIAPSNNLLPESSNSYLIPNGFSSEQFYRVSETEKEALKIENNCQGKIVFLCARRWAPNKGIIYLAKALNLLSDEVKQKSVFIFAGNESEGFQAYKKQINQELSECSNTDIRLMGNLSHEKLAPLINMSDVGVIPSIMEGLSLFSLELISTGVPVLATNVGGLPDVVKNEETGWIVLPKSPENIEKEITKIVINWPDSKLEINTEEFKEKYSWKTVANLTLKIYNKIT